MAVRLRAFIVQLLREATPESTTLIPRNAVYDHPSIAALTDYVLNRISAPEVSQTEEDDAKYRVRRTVERYTSGLAPRSVSPDADNLEEDEYVVITGTTGSLGVFLLDQLLDRPTVKRIYCFNRKLDLNTTQRQLNAFEERGLDRSKLQAALGDRVSLAAPCRRVAGRS